MNKNILIGILVIVIVLETSYLGYKKIVRPQPTVMTQEVNSIPSPSGIPTGRPQMLTKGMKLAESPIEKFAYKIAPGDVADDVKKVLTGFSIKTKALPDKSLQVDLVPKDSNYEFQTYIVKPGNTLYFIEMTPNDDKVDQDKDINYRDDYGIIVDKDGIVQ